jgi:hypothetical protein
MESKKSSAKTASFYLLLCFECKCNELCSARDFLVSDDKFPTCSTWQYLKIQSLHFNQCKSNIITNQNPVRRLKKYLPKLSVISLLIAMLWKISFYQEI